MSHRATLFLLFLLALPLAAQQRITRIDVAGDVPASIVVPQSALVTGRSYSESDLDVAVARIRRLPFVYDARWTLSGETLRIDVTGMTRIFGELTLLGAKSRFDEDTATFLGAGARQFLGAGVFEGRLGTVLGEGDETLRAQVGYSHYSIGGTRLFATLSADAPMKHSDGFDPDPTWQFTIGYPVTVRQTLTASAQRTGFHAERTLQGLPRPLVSESENDSYEVRWTFDTSDDPFFARRGTILNAAHAWRNFDATFEAGTIPLPPAQPQIFTTRSERDSRAVEAGARQYWSIGTRSTVFGALEGSYSRDNFEQRANDDPSMFGTSKSNAVRLSLGLGHNFFDRNSPVKNGRHRIEIGGKASRRESETLAFERSDDETSVELAYLYRRRFATVRVNLLWGWD